jgi:uncharacterized protein YdiU (UPF0061 family)
VTDLAQSTVRPFEFDNTYVRQLDGFYAPWRAVEVADPRLLRFNDALAGSLGLDPLRFDGPLGASIFSGNDVPDGAEPIAQAYAGHQFGGFAPQLGDGRALLLGEIVAPHGARYDIALKGSGRTPFSRGGDGRATLGPVLREYLMGEAMFALGIPTTRALAAVTTGESVHRERALPGAVLTRVAASHIRVGTFQFFAARGEIDKVRRLVEYSLQRHDPALVEDHNPALALLATVIARQTELIAAWMNTGFIHGVMNTDNVTVSGETIDFGPCAFIEEFDPRTVFSSIDEGGRYAYGNQPAIGKWNMARLAEALLPLIDADTDRAVELAMDALDTYDARYEQQWLTRARRKLGLTAAAGDDRSLVADWLDLLARQRVDFTLAWRRLADSADGDGGEDSALRSLFSQPAELDEWLSRWRRRLPADDHDVGASMRRVSPIYVPRNHLVEEALAAAIDHDDLGPFDRLLSVVTSPYDERPEDDRYAQPAPHGFTAGYRTFCGT